MTAFFIAGAGTDIGKTFVTERLIALRHARGGAARALKPVASGVPALQHPAFAESDTARLLRAQTISIDAAAVAACSPWRFAAPLSPDMAAAAEGRRVTLSEVAQWTRGAIAEAPDGAFVFVEGAGGVMSPICEDGTNLDLILELRCPTLLVVGAYLGAISHCLTGLEALKARRAPLVGVILNEGAEPTGDLEATAASIRRFAPDAPLVLVRRDAVALPESLHSLLERTPD